MGPAGLSCSPTCPGGRPGRTFRGRASYLAGMPGVQAGAKRARGAASEVASWLESNPPYRDATP